MKGRCVTVAPAARAISTVRSEEWESTTWMSSDTADAARSVSAMIGSELNVRMTTEMPINPLSNDERRLSRYGLAMTDKIRHGKSVQSMLDKCTLYNQ